MSKQPPKYPLQFFRWFCNPDYVEDIEGDLLERFEKRPSRWLFTFDVMKLFRPGIIKNFEGTQQLNNYGMIKSMIIIAWRNALRQKQFTSLNILGLTIGIATSILIGLYIYDETSYDSFHANADRIYRVNQPNIWSDWNDVISNTGPNVATALREDAPEFEQITRLMSLGEQTVTSDKISHANSFKETQMYAAEENFFDVFSFEFLHGNPTTSLQEPMNMLMTLETVQRYFGQEINPEEAIDRTVEVKDYDGTWNTYTVKGVLADVPYRSHIQFDILVSLKSQSEMMDMHGWKWIWTAFSTYGLVKEGTNVASLERDIQAIPEKWAPPTTTRIFNQTVEEFTDGNPWKLQLQPLSEVYIAGTPDFHAFGPTGNPQFVKIFGAIGLLVLILSAINFMNLSTARSTNRSKEVGIRKVLGSQRKALLSQFILESVLFVTVSTLLAFSLVQLTLESFNKIADKHIEFLPHFSNPFFYATTLGFILVVGVLAGSYPAFYLSSFRPIETLKGKISAGFKGKGIRNGLVVFQFTISIALIICTFFVQKQLSHTSSLDVGFAKNNILQLHNVEQLGFETEALKNRLSSNPSFTAVGKSFGIPPNIWSGDRYKDTQPESQVVQFSNFRTEGDYLELLGLKFAAGRNFDASRISDNDAVILNEEALKVLGWSSQDLNSSIGKSIALASGDEQEFEVIGIVEDFNFSSVKQKIAPLVIINMHNENVWDYGAGLSYYSMRLNPETITTAADLHHLLEDLEEELAQVDATIPFEYSFMDQAFEDTFQAEQKMGLILNLFTFMAMIIACLGLFGLAAFSAEQRIKELGIRKVLGAKVSELVVSFSKEFTKLILLSILLACPIAWFLVSKWLEDFAYSTPISIWVFVIATISALIIAIATISFQSLRVANRNPIESLKDE